MRYDKIENIIKVFFVMWGLHLKGTDQSVGAIANALNGTLDETTIYHHRFQLEQWGAVKAPLGLRAEDERAGYTFHFTIHPEEIPDFIWYVETKRRIVQKQADDAVSRGLAKYDKEGLRFDAEGFLKLIPDEFFRDIQKTVAQKYNRHDVTKEQIIELIKQSDEGYLEYDLNRDQQPLIEFFKFVANSIGQDN